jgi:YjbE family integral membrane protein
VGSFLQVLDPANWGALIQYFLHELSTPMFWVALGKIMWINILLSGDNAVVIAMACRSLPPRQRFWGMVLGAGVAVALRIVFTIVIASLMLMPYLKLIGGLALFYIAVKLMVPDDEHKDMEAADKLWRAVQMVAVADIIMSLDNVIAIAAAAQGSYMLLVIGLAVSIPLIIAGAALIMSLLDRFPILIWAGAALLGWIVGEVIVTDPAIEEVLIGRFGASVFHTIELSMAALGAIAVLVVGGLWRRSKNAKQGTATGRPDEVNKEAAE